MLLKVLVDNNTYIDEYYLGEPAVCYYLENGEDRLLFDTGYSDIFISNAGKLGIRLEEINKIVFSHGHNDHTLGMKYLAERYDLSNVEVIAHPDCFIEKKDETGNIGAPFNNWELEKICRPKFDTEPVKLSDNLIFMGEIPQIFDYEKRKRIGKCYKNGVWEPDYVIEDSAIVHKSKEGLFIITGCSHSGICNIIEHAKNLCGCDRIRGVIGGFHLFEDNEQLNKTIEYLKTNEIHVVYPCHCVSFKAKAKMNEQLNVHEVGVGLSIEI